MIIISNIYKINTKYKLKCQLFNFFNYFNSKKK